MATQRGATHREATQRDRAKEPGAECQLYAVVEAGPAAAERISALLAAYPLSSLLIVPREGQSLTAAALKPLVESVQKKNCAVLLADDAALARTLRADGVHLSFGVDLVARYDEARSILGAGAIVGVDVGLSRHLAMQLGEAGADYIGFSATEGPPAAMAVSDDEPELEDEDVGPRRQDELVAWWSEVFEVPCVAFDVASDDAARHFAAQGADFVAVRCAGGDAIAASVDRLKAFARAVGDGDAG